MSDEKAPRRGRKTLTEALAGGSPAARRRAAVVLEVLGGARNPASAAQALEVTVGAYYAIEVRAVAGLVAGCEPARRGRATDGSMDSARLERELARVRRDRDRYEALLRASHRVVGVPPPPAPKGTGKRRRGPTIRALTAARALAGPPEQVGPTLAEGTRAHGDSAAGGRGAALGEDPKPP